MSDTLIGKKLGDYVIQEILGRGGMAHVYRGYDPNLQRFAAVKVIDSAMLSKGHEEEYRARFRREARAIARLTHPNIVGVYQFGEFGALYYMAMEFIDGRDLGQILKSRALNQERLSPRQIVRIISHISAALDYAHMSNVIHRDIKPSNIMVTNDQRAVLTDFGLALDVPEGTGGNTFGSAHYIAPEQAISSRNAVPQSDLYSLGVVMYQMVTGRVPFDDSSAMSVALKHLSDPPPPPRTVDPSISPAVEQVILKALEKEPSKRYKNGEAMARALEEALDLLPPGGDPLSYDYGSRPSRLFPPLNEFATSATSPKKKTREMEAIGSPTIQFADTDVNAARRTIQQAQAAMDRERRRPMLIAGGVGAGVVALLLIAVFAISQMGAAPPVTLTAPAVVDAGTPDSAPAGGNDATEAETEGAPRDTAEPPTDAPEESPVPTETEAAADTPEPTTDSAPVAVTEADPPDPTEADPTEADPPTHTASPTRTSTDAPSDTPTPTDTASPAPSATVVDGSVSGGAVINPDTPLVLIYDPDNLVLFNRSSEAINVSGLVFEQRVGNTVLAFEATSWATEYITALPAGDCLMLWRIGTREVPTPDYCGIRQAWFAVGTPRRFWLSPDESVMFDVFRFGVPVATCPVNRGDCGIDVPS